MKRILLPVIGCAVLLAACGNRPRPGATSSGTLALTRDDALLYAVNADLDRVEVIDASRHEVVATVPVGRLPERILIAPDDTVYVANRGDRSLSVFRRGEWSDVARIPVGVEPVGLAISGDGQTLYVVNAAANGDSEHGSLMAIDTRARHPKWEMLLPADARGIALLEDARAVISLYRAGEIIEVNLGTQEIVRGEGTSRLYETANLNASGGVADPTDSQMATSRPRAVDNLVLSPDGRHLYATTTWASEAVLNTSDAPLPGKVGGGGSAYGMGGCATSTPVAAPGVATFDPETLAARADSSQECFVTESREFPATRLTSFTGEPVQGPAAVLVDGLGDWVFIAMRESNNIAVVPTVRGSPTSSLERTPMVGTGIREVVRTDRGPSGLALSSDGRRLYVHNSFSHTLQVIESGGSGALRVTRAPLQLARVEELEAAGLTPDIRAGRDLFFSADNPQMNDPSIGISCASCHLEGREDGHVWLFSEGPRQTPSLAGRKLGLTAPYHWGGEHPDFASFLEHTVGERMGGAGLSSEQQAQLLAFIDWMPAPDNPHALPVPSEAQVRGAHVFQRAGCTECHAGETLASDKNEDVGTLVRYGRAPDTFDALNTPSLLGLARTAPYLHDGSAPTLKARLLGDKASNRHGQTAALTDAEIDDLVEYLKSL